MKRLACIIILAAAAFAPLCAAYGVGASQQWVRDYVRTNAADAATASASETLYSYAVKDGVMTVTASNAVDMVTLSGEVPDNAALGVTNCTAAAVSKGVTNGTLFAWIGGGVYTNAVLGDAVACTATNLVYRGVPSVVTNGIDRIDGCFDCYGTRVTNTVRDGLLSGKEAAK